VPGAEHAREWGTLLLGGRRQRAGLDTNVGASLALGTPSGPDFTLFASLGGRF
jgi:hypothetical protein